MSTFMMFVPWKTQFIFILILMLGLSYLESKGRGKIWPPLQWLKKIKNRKGPAHRDRTSRTEFDHISAIGPGAQHRLEQLESLKTAGLISRQEYQQKRQEILNGL